MDQALQNTELDDIYILYFSLTWIWTKPKEYSIVEVCIYITHMWVYK
jgi:hypothetical protein